MTEDPSRELVDQLGRLLEQAADKAIAPLPRISAVIASGAYLEALSRQLVAEAREQGHTWDDLAEVFATSAASVKNRFDSYRTYEDEAD